MLKELAFLIYYHKDNRHSFNALVGAIETESELNDIDIYFFENDGELIQQLDELKEKYGEHELL